MDFSELKGRPYCKICSWMTADLKLKGRELYVFALLFERDASDAPDRERIDGAYIAEMCDVSVTEVFQIFNALERKGLLRVGLGADGISAHYTVDRAGVMTAVSGGDQADNE